MLRQLFLLLCILLAAPSMDAAADSYGWKAQKSIVYTSSFSGNPLSSMEMVADDIQFAQDDLISDLDDDDLNDEDLSDKKLSRHSGARQCAPEGGSSKSISDTLPGLCSLQTSRFGNIRSTFPEPFLFTGALRI